MTYGKRQICRVMCHQHVETSVLHWLPLRSTPCRAFALQQRRKLWKQKPSRFPSRAITARKRASSAALKANCSPTKTPAATCPSRWIMATTGSLIPRGKHSSAKPTARSTNLIPAYASVVPARGRVCLRWRLSRRMGWYGFREGRVPPRPNPNNQIGQGGACPSR